jgi:hypothetical protein
MKEMRCALLIAYKIYLMVSDNGMVAWYGTLWYAMGVVWCGLIIIVFPGCLKGSPKVLEYYKDVIYLRVLNLGILNSLGSKFSIH